MSYLFISINIYIVVYLIESILSMLDVSFYFERGIPIFKKEIPFIDPNSESIGSVTNILSIAANKNGWYPEVRLHKKQSKIYIKHLKFRFSIFENKRLLPILHGKIENHDDELKSFIVGYLNWNIPFFGAIPIALLVLIFNFGNSMLGIIVYSIISLIVVGSVLLLGFKNDIDKYNRIVNHARTYYSSRK